VLDRVGGLKLPDPVIVAPTLRSALLTITDPRQRRGVRHGLVALLSVAVCAVATGARSFVAIAEWAADLPTEVATTLGTGPACPSESAIRRFVQRLDADRFDQAIGARLQQHCTRIAPSGRRRVLAVDGKTLRGSRTSDGRARHLLAIIDHDTAMVLGQTGVDGKTNEIIAFTPLIGTLTSPNLAGAVIIADAMHTQRGHARHLHNQGAHWLLTVKATSPGCAVSSPACPGPGRGLPPQHRQRPRPPEIRALKAVTVATGIAFPYAAQAIQVTRRTRPLRATSKNKWRTETVYAITDLHPTPGPTRRTRRLAAPTLSAFQLDLSLSGSAPSLP
jgi:hypothetical protein